MTRTHSRTRIARLTDNAKVLVAVKCMALLASVGLMLACSESSALDLSAQGFRQMGGPRGAAGYLLMSAAAADARVKEQRAHERELAQLRARYDYHTPCSNCRHVVYWDGKYTRVRCNRCSHVFVVNYR